MSVILSANRRPVSHAEQYWPASKQGESHGPGTIPVPWHRAHDNDFPLVFIGSSHDPSLQ
jgi:hypothetical protein